jgi:hypothetical protein
VTTPQLTWAWAAGAVVSDARDLAIFFDRLLTGQLLRKDLLSRMQDTNGTARDGVTPHGHASVHRRL